MKDLIGITRPKNNMSIPIKDQKILFNNCVNGYRSKYLEELKSEDMNMSTAEFYLKMSNAFEYHLQLITKNNEDGEK